MTPTMPHWPDIHQLPGLLILLVLGPTAPSACEPFPPLEMRIDADRPITIFSDGSFRDAAEDDEYEPLSGGPVRDVGGGRVGQVIQRDLSNCAVYESLIVVDCTTAEAIMVDGVGQPMSGANLATAVRWASTRALQPPYGPLALTSTTLIADVAALAAREGWTMRTDVPAFASERGPQNRFDPFMGCEIFYPGSVGAER